MGGKSRFQHPDSTGNGEGDSREDDRQGDTLRIGFWVQTRMPDPIDHEGNDDPDRNDRDHQQDQKEDPAQPDILNGVLRKAEEPVKPVHYPRTITPSAQPPEMVSSPGRGDWEVTRDRSMNQTVGSKSLVGYGRYRPASETTNPPHTTPSGTVNDHPSNPVSPHSWSQHISWQRRNPTPDRHPLAPLKVQPLARCNRRSQRGVTSICCDSTSRAERVSPKMRQSGGQTDVAVTLTVGSICKLFPGNQPGLFTIVGVAGSNVQLVSVDSASNTSPFTVASSVIQSTYASA